MSESVTKQDLIDFIAAKPSDKFHLIIQPDRLVVHVLTSFIEYNWYRPGTPANNLFSLRLYKWLDTGVWMIVSIPKDKFAATKQVADLLGLKLAEGSPVVMPVDANTEDAFLVPGQQFYAAIFPGARFADGSDNTNVFTVENRLRAQNTRLNHDEIYHRSRIVSRLMPAKKIPIREAADYIYGRSNDTNWPDRN